MEVVLASRIHSCHFGADAACERIEIKLPPGFVRDRGRPGSPGRSGPAVLSRTRRDIAIVGKVEVLRWGSEAESKEAAVGAARRRHH